MKTISTTFLAVLLFCFTVNAQHIPDKNFADAIRSKYSSCIDDNNDLLPAAKSIEKLEVQNAGIESLEGIQGFTSLIALDFRNNRNIKSIPVLPVSIKKLWMGYTGLNSLNELPPSLELLEVNRCPLTSLPALPSSLLILLCEESGLTSLPHLPEGLTDLYANYSPITSLPNIPASLNVLYIFSTKITYLPPFPDGLSYFKISDNMVDCIPSNNPKLWIRDINGDPIKTTFCPGGTKYATANAGNNEKKAAVVPDGGKCISGNCKNGIGTFEGVEQGEHVTYKGSFRDGKYNGSGTMIVKNSFRYTGSFKDGKMDGKGTITFTEGSVYTGEISAGFLEGNGTLLFKDGKKSTGIWKHSKLWSGTGLFNYGDHDFYYGGVIESLRDGQGLRSYPNGKKFIGTFSKGNEVTGNGYIQYLNNASYEGAIVNGKYTGYGIHIYSNGDKYKGNFTDGNRTGKGDLFDKDGNLDYSGEWFDDEMHRPEKSARIKKESEQAFSRVTFKGWEEVTMNGQKATLDITVDYYFDDFGLHGTQEEVMVTTDDTKYRRKINFTGMYYPSSSKIFCHYQNTISFDPLPDGLYWKGDDWEAVLYNDKQHSGYHVIEGKTTEGSEYHVADYY